MTRIEAWARNIAHDITMAAAAALRTWQHCRHMRRGTPAAVIALTLSA